MNTLVAIQNLHKVYFRGSERIDVLQGVNMDVPQGDFLALMGPSGSGKTTLLNLMGGLDTPTSGAVEIGGVRVVRDHHDRLAVIAVQRFEQFQDLVPRLAIEVAGRLVAEQQCRVGDDGAGDADTLLLAARELARIVVHAVAEADDRQRHLDPVLPIGLLQLREQQRQLHVARRRQHRKQVVQL